MSTKRSKSRVQPESLLARIASRDFTVGIMGMGYVGLPLALAAANAGFRVVGFDIDAARVSLLNRGESGIKHISGDPIAHALAKGLFRATTDLSELNVPDAILIAVPTPLSKQREPDLTFVESSARSVAASLRGGQLVVLESTTWPGTTREIIQPILEGSRLHCGTDFFLAFSPEREDPGNASFRTSIIPKVVGADDPTSLKITRALYDQMIERTVPVRSAATAEAVKLTENIFRSVNIALVNELKVIFDRMGIDVWEVIDAAKTKPFGYMPFYPGPGLGGHCIPIDPFYLSWKAREFEIATQFIELAGQINTHMPHYVVNRLAEALDRRTGRGLNGSRILMLGIAYKKNIEDIRESPALKLIELIEQRGGKTTYHDPYVKEIPKTREHSALQGRRSVPINRDILAECEAIVIATDHDMIDWEAVATYGRLVIDTRNICARNGFAGEHIVKA